MPDTTTRQPLKILLLQPDREQSKVVVGQLGDAGFAVEAEIVDSLQEFEARLRSENYDLAINSLQLAQGARSMGERSRALDLAVAEATSKVQAMAGACPLAIMSLDLDGNVKMWNRGAEHMFGWMETEVLGKPLPTVPEDRREEYRQLLDSQFHGVSHIGVRVHRRRKDGQFIDASLWTVPLRDAAAAIYGNVAILADLSAADEAEREYRDMAAREAEARAEIHAERRFRELLEAAPDAILEVDSRGRIVLMNAVAENLTGYSREELLGQSIEILTPEELRVRHAGHRAGYWAHPMLRPMGTGLDLHVQRKDGTRAPVEISLSPLTYDGEKRVTAVIRDVTERKRSERQLREMHERFTADLTAANKELEARNRQIESANRLKSEFLASMSHELRTPLHTIIGFSELLAEELEGPLNEKQQRFVDHIHRDSLHLLELINDMLDISKIEAGRLELRREAFDIATAHRGSRSPRSGRRRRRSRSDRDQRRRSRRRSLHADRLRFKQILFNLLSNAVKFTPEGGSIRVEARSQTAFVEISVTDTGIGIPCERARGGVRQVLSGRSDHQGLCAKGTGLGLAITQAPGGGARRDGSGCESEPGKGSRFTFTIPIEEPWTVRQHRMKKVLVADDKPTSRELVRTVLEKSGYPVVEAGDGVEALRQGARESRRI